MEKLKQYMVFTVLGCLVVLAAGWFLLVSPKRSDAAALRSSASTQVTANAQLQTELQVLKAQAKALPKQQAKLAAVAAKIPDNPALPSLIRALTAASASAGVELVQVTPGAPAVVGAAAPGAAALAAPAAANASSAGTLTSISLNLSVIGGYFQLEQFMANAENLSRSLRVSSLALGPGTNPVKQATAGTVDDGRTLGATITAQVFMAANRPAATAVTAPGAVVVAPITPAKK
jgi:Tfp pilus assembly protein PilO